MTIQRSLNFDFNDPAICSWLKGRDGRYTSGADLRNERLADGYAIFNVRSLQPADDVSLPLFFEHECEVRSASGRLMYKRKIVDVVMYTLSVDVTAILYLRGVDPAMTQKLVDIFTATDLNDVDQAEADLLAGGISSDSYQVDLEIVIAIKKETGSQRALLDTFVQQIEGQYGRDGKRLYSVNVLGEPRIVCDGDLPQFPDSDIVVVGDITKPGDELLSDARKKNPRCDNIEIVDYEVGTAFQYPEYKQEWGKKKLRIGRCWTWIWWPTTFTRTRKYVLHAFVVATPDIRRAFERAIRDCLEDSAIKTGVLVLVTGGMSLPAAVTVFVTACQLCLESKLEDIVDCVIPGMKLVTEIGEWHLL